MHRYGYLLFCLVFLSGCYVGINSELGSPKDDAPSQLVGQWAAIDGSDDIMLEPDVKDKSRLLYSDGWFKKVPVKFYKFGQIDLAAVRSSVLPQASNAAPLGDDFYKYFKYEIKDGVLHIREMNYEFLANSGIAKGNRYACHILTSYFNDPVANRELNDCIVLDVDEQKLGAIIKSDEVFGQDVRFQFTDR